MINCIVIDDEPLAKEKLVSYVNKVPDFELVGAFDHALPAMDVIRKGKIDLVFSDIQMPDITGISFLKTLKNPPLFVFVTGNPQYAVESYELDVLDYILKPFDFDRFMKSVNKVVAFMDSEISTVPNKDFFVFRERGTNVIVKYDEIFYVEGNKDYVNVVTGEKDYMVWKKMAQMEAELPKDLFTRVQKSYIINLSLVKEVSASLIKMKGNIKDIPVGATYRDELYRRLGIDKR